MPKVKFYCDSFYPYYDFAGGGTFDHEVEMPDSEIHRMRRVMGEFHALQDELKALLRGPHNARPTQSPPLGGAHVPDPLAPRLKPTLRPFNKAELAVAASACRVADEMCKIDPDLKHDECIAFAYQFVLAKHALKIVQSDIVKETTAQTDEQETNT